MSGANRRRPAAPTSVRPSSAPKKRTWSVRDGGDIMDAEISVFSFSRLAGALPPPAIIDVRHAAAFECGPRVIPRAIRRPPDLEAWQAILEPWRTIVVYCVHGGDVSRDIAAALAHRGFDARYLAGGIEAWGRDGHALEPFSPPTRWVTRERPQIDRIACQ